MHQAKNPFLTSQGSILINPQTSNQNIYNIIGVIRANFRNQKGHIISICYGTAFAVSKRFIITCAHNIFHQQLWQSANEIYFIPNIKQGKIHHGIKIYKSVAANYAQFQKPKTTYLDAPIPQDVALIALNEQLQNQWFPQIGIGFNDQFPSGSTIRIGGYPSANYLACRYLYTPNFQRKDLMGNLICICNHVIFHEMSTEMGHSGSPIFTINSQGQAIVIGVHTHKGNKNIKMNKGVFFTDDIVKRLKRYEQSFQKQFEIKQRIKFRVDRFRNTDQLIHSINPIKLHGYYCESLSPISRRFKFAQKAIQSSQQQTDLKQQIKQQQQTLDLSEY